MLLKKALVRLADVIAAPVTILAAWHLWLLRRAGLSTVPVSRWILRAVGVLPIRRHYYEPLFHPDDLSGSLQAERKLPGIDLNADGQLAWLGRFSFQAEIEAMCLGAPPRTFWGRALTPDNGAFARGDIDFYYSLIRLLKPRRLIEIGAGYSTMVAICAIERNQSEAVAKTCELIAVEPYSSFEDERVKILRVPVEKVGGRLFAELKANDILFIDSSHVIRPQGDVLCEVLQILPTLAAGVVVHVHDIFTPGDYPREWVVDRHMFWNEQYLMEAFLTGNPDFEIIGALNWLKVNHARLLEEKCPTLRGCPQQRPSSFWIRRKTGPTRV